MEREYRVLLLLDVQTLASSPEDAEKQVHDELDDTGRDVLSTVSLKGYSVKLPCAPTLRAVRQTVTLELADVTAELIKAKMKEIPDQMGAKTRRKDVIAAIEKRKAMLNRILEETNAIYNNKMIYTVETSMTVDVFAESEKESIEGACEEIEKPGREIYEANLDDEIRRTWI